MNKIPKFCDQCDFYTSCNSAMGLEDCHFYPYKSSFKSFVKVLFSKIFH